jgi:dUTP pyrophosphatase|uniref:dUTP diphosphatase n=1 Tax=virus sp. ctiha2 TaxID=2827299 RepID=A0A8S5RG86_9VIRU|nr:MAG TPA: dUTPase [virus sp. ctiha2]
MKIINIKKTDENAKIPTYGSVYAAGADLYAVIHNEENKVEILPGETAFIDTGIVMEIPNGYVGLVYARSGLSCKQGLAPANKVGVIDSDYRGNIMVALYNQSNETRIVSEGDRIAQIIIQPVEQFGFKVTENLSNTVRGNGGFGSSGRA